MTYTPTWIRFPKTEFEYAVLPQKMDFNTAKTSCMSYTANYPSNLASINSKMEFDFIVDEVLPTLSNETAFWIGARSIATYPKKKPLAQSWEWIDQSDFSTILRKFFRPGFESCRRNPTQKGCCVRKTGKCLFAPGQPNRRDSRGTSCMFISTGENNVGFNDARCTRMNFALCKRQNEFATTIATEPAPTFDTTAATMEPSTTPGDDNSNWFNLNPVFISSTRVPGPNAIASFGRFVFVADNDFNKVHKFEVLADGTLSFIRKWGGLGSANGKFSSIGELGVSPDGHRLYVVDTNNRRVQVFDTTGEFLFSFGSSGSGDGQFVSPRGLAVSPATSAGFTITVSDTASHNIQQFDSEGNFLRKFAGLDAPASVSYASDGTLFVTDSNRDRVSAYHRLNNQVPLFSFGSSGTTDGLFSYPACVTVASDGKIIVADVYNHRIQIFSSRGEFLGKFGTAGDENGAFLNPLAAAISNSFIIVANTMNGRVDVFGQAPVTTVSP